MSVFEYVAGMITVVLGLGVAHLLGSLGSLAASQGRIRAHWVQILWIVLLLGLHLQAWLSLWSLRGLSEWRIGQMVGSLVAAGLIVIVSRILVPHVDSTRRWTFESVTSRSVCVSLRPSPRFGSCASSLGSRSSEEIRGRQRGYFKPRGLCCPWWVLSSRVQRGTLLSRSSGRCY